MQDIYFTRHGETVWNVENKICGVTDIALTDRGREQARALGRQLAAGEQGIARILCSPLVRAKETAELIAAETGLPLAVDERLREQAFGRYEGTARKRPGVRAGQAPLCRPLRGRGEYAAAGRPGLQPAGRAGRPRGRPGPAGGAQRNFRVVQSYFYEMTNEEFALFGIKNCELVKYTY